MAYEFKRLADVELLDKVPEGCSVLAEVDGAERRLPSEGLGSSSNALIFVGTMASDGGEEMPLMNISTLSSSAPLFESIVANMDFADAYAAYEAGEILSACGYSVQGESLAMFPVIIYHTTHHYGVESLAINVQGLTFYWTADGISIDEPAGER